MVSPEVIVIAAFHDADVVRLHALLVAYESPIATPDQERLRCEDVRAHRELCDQIGRLLADATLVADGGKL